MPEGGGLFDLAGRTAVVSGASRGIGQAIAAGLVAAGARVYGLSRTGAGDGPDGVLHRACDLADPAAALAALEGIAGVDILVNAAGASFAADRAGAEADLARFTRTMALNVTAAYALCLAARPLMGRGGSIVNVTSINAELGFPGNPGYVASKAALAGLTRALAVDFAADGIRVNALAPGYVHTAMTEASHADPEAHAVRSGRAVLGRWGEVGDMVGTAIYLASHASAYVTGQQIFVDGGWTVQGLPR